MSAIPSPLNVLVAGYGMVGKAVLDALTDPEYSSPARPVQVKAFVLVKPSSLADPTKRAVIDSYTAKGVTVVEGDIEQGAQLGQTLKTHSIHTVVSVVGFQQSQVQWALLEAAKAGGVKHFIPSDFGLDYEAIHAGHPMYDVLAKAKQELHAAIKQSGMDWTFIATGDFAEVLFGWPYMLGVDLASRTVIAPGSLSNTTTITAARDIGLLTAAAIVDPQARNQQLHIGRQYTYEQVAAALEAATGDKVTRTTRSKEDMEAALEKNPMDFPARFGLTTLLQTGRTWPDKQTYKYGQFSYTPLETVAREVTKKTATQ